jgi:hypothetical protein
MKVRSYGMTKQKVTLTIDSEQIEALRSLVGARSLSASVEAAIAAHVGKLKHLRAVDEWLAELEADYGPVPTETLEWAAQIFDQWEAATKPKRSKRTT